MDQATTQGHRFDREMTLSAAVLLVVFGLAASVARPTDEQLRNAVEDAILADSLSGIEMIDVAVSNGIVLLTGSVDDLLARERAVRTAGTVRGVRAVIGAVGLDPPGEHDDVSLLGDLFAALRADPATEPYEIEPFVEKGIVTLGGAVDSWQERFLVEEVVKGVPGVLAVDNVIEVDPSPSRADDEIRAEIEKGLDLNALVDGSTIDVQVSNGRVSLQGSVGSAAERRRAVAEAWTAGVRAVYPEGLVISDSDDRETRRVREHVYLQDGAIQAAVEDALLLDPRVIATGIEVSVANGIVTLDGSVDSMSQRQAAGDDARQTTGVHLVRNRLAVLEDEQARK